MSSIALTNLQTTGGNKVFIPNEQKGYLKKLAQVIKRIFYFFRQSKKVDSNNPPLLKLPQLKEKADLIKIFTSTSSTSKNRYNKHVNELEVRATTMQSYPIIDFIFIKNKEEFIQHLEDCIVHIISLEGDTVEQDKYINRLKLKGESLDGEYRDYFFNRLDEALSSYNNSREATKAFYTIRNEEFNKRWKEAEGMFEENKIRTQQILQDRYKLA